MSTGLVLNDRYRLLERLAVGGMGEVWRAADVRSGRQVAVKLLRLEFGSDMRARGRFESEARFAMELRHPGIARAFDFGEHAGRTYLVMELVTGEPLDEVLARDGGLPLEAVLDLVVQAGRALTVAHDAGIVHRDVKPANLMVSPDGILKITDFGIARRLAAASQTQTGMVMGTAHYISPEQAQGKELSPKADLYSLGVVAYECLTGAPPFDGSTPVEVALKHVRDAPAELPARVPAAARELIMEMLAKDPLDRPRDAGAVAARALAIRAALVGAPFGTRPGAQPDGRPGGRPGAHPGARPAVRPGTVVSPGRDPIVTQSAPSSGFDADRPADSLTDGTVQRRTAVTYASVAAVLVVVCVIVIGSLWKGLAFAGSAEDERDPPASPATSPVGGDLPGGPREDPAARPRSPEPRSPEHRSPEHRASRTPGRPAVTPRHRTHRIRPSTRVRPETSPSHKPSTKSPRATPTAPEPTPTPTGSTTTPSTPSPVASPTQTRRLGSEDKV